MRCYDKSRSVNLFGPQEVEKSLLFIVSLVVVYIYIWMSVGYKRGEFIVLALS